MKNKIVIGVTFTGLLMQQFSLPLDFFTRNNFYSMSTSIKVRDSSLDLNYLVENKGNLVIRKVNYKKESEYEKKENNFDRIEAAIVLLEKEKFEKKVEKSSSFGIFLASVSGVLLFGEKKYMDKGIVL